MKYKHKKIKMQGIKISVEKDKQEIARAYLYILHNYPEKKPYGFLAEVSVDENLRGKGVGKKLINEIIEEAKKNKCYKIVATSRKSKPKVHTFYEYLGFKNVGFEFRINL
jgi:GNAT superfamily N-acetyltransferase